MVGLCMAIRAVVRWKDVLSVTPQCCRENSESCSKEDIPEWLKQELPPPPRRDRLPAPKQREKSVSLWSIIKECVGKDLSRVCLPVFFNEQLSSLQRIAEDMEYSELLDEVCTLT